MIHKGGRLHMCDGLLLLVTAAHVEYVRVCCGGSLGGPARRQSPLLGEHVQQRCGLCPVATSVAIVVACCNRSVSSSPPSVVRSLCWLVSRQWGRYRMSLSVTAARGACARTLSRLSLSAPWPRMLYAGWARVVVARLGSCRARVGLCRAAWPMSCSRPACEDALRLWFEDSMRRAAARSVSRVVFAGPPL